MPIRLMLYFALITPLLGIIQVENGAYAPSVGVTGGPNGATWLFSLYSLCTIIGATLVTRGDWILARGERQSPPVSVELPALVRILRLALVANGILLAAMLLLFGGISVLAGDVGKGEFRASLGGLGAIAYLTLKWFSPTLFAYACACYLMAGRPAIVRSRLLLLGLMSFLIGMSWGFKTTGLIILMPGFIVILWNKGLRAYILPAVFAVVSTFVAVMMFDRFGEYDAAGKFLLERLTVYQGDVSWYTWEQLESGRGLPNYWHTPAAAIGDQFLMMLTGISREDPSQWIDWHYGAMLTATATGSFVRYLEGHSVTGTPFSEGLFAFGAAGALIFGVLAGIITGFVFRRVKRAIANGRPRAAALWSNYAVFAVFAWLNGGEIVQLFHVSLLVGVLAARLLLSLLAALGAIPPPLTPPRVASAPS